METAEDLEPFIKWREQETWSVAVNGDSKNVVFFGKCRHQRSSGAIQQITQEKV
jgi:hypothetical protein